MLLCLSDYIAKGILLTFTDCSINEIPVTTAARICRDSRRQSEYDIHDLGHFRKRLLSVKPLKAKDRFRRIFRVYLSPMNSYLVCDLCKRERRKVVKNRIIEFFVIIA